VVVVGREVGGRRGGGGRVVGGGLGCNIIPGKPNSEERKIG